MKLSGADGSAAMTWTDKLASVSNYYIVNNPAKWRTNVPHYQRVQARDVYPGIDLQYYGNEGRQEHDFLVAAGADPARIRLQLSGADKTLLTAAGDLSLGTSLAT